MASHDFNTMRKFSSRVIICDGQEVRETANIQEFESVNA